MHTRKYLRPLQNYHIASLTRNYCPVLTGFCARGSHSHRVDKLGWEHQCHGFDRDLQYCQLPSLRRHRSFGWSYLREVLGLLARRPMRRRKKEMSSLEVGASLLSRKLSLYKTWSVVGKDFDTGERTRGKCFTTCYHCDFALTLRDSTCCFIKDLGRLIAAMLRVFFVDRSDVEFLG